MAVFLLVLKIIGITLLCLLGLVVLFLFLPVGVSVRYKNELSVKAKILFLKFTVYPEKPDKKTKKKEHEKGGQNKQKKPISLDTVKRMLEPVGSAAGFLLRRIRISRIEVVMPVSAADPASLAIKYGEIQAVGGMVLAFMQNTFIIKIKEYSVIPDFEGLHSDGERYGCDISAIPLTLLVALLIFLSRYRSAESATAKETLNERR